MILRHTWLCDLKVLHTRRKIFHCMGKEIFSVYFPSLSDCCDYLFEENISLMITEYIRFRRAHTIVERKEKISRYFVVKEMYIFTLEICTKALVCPV